MSTTASHVRLPLLALALLLGCESDDATGSTDAGSSDGQVESDAQGSDAASTDASAGDPDAEPAEGDGGADASMEEQDAETLDAEPGTEDGGGDAAVVEGDTGVDDAGAGNDATTMTAGDCTLWDSFPPSTKYGQVVATASGFAVIDSQQVYSNAAGQWSVDLPAQNVANVPRLTRLVAGDGWLGAVREDGTVLRGSAAPLVTIGTFANITAVAAYGNTFWLATSDGKLRAHDGTSWAEVGTAAAPIIAVGETSRGLLALTTSYGYTRDGTGFHAIAVPAATFAEIATSASGDVVARAGSSLYRFEAGALVLNSPSPCTTGSVSAIFGGASIAANCSSVLMARSSTGSWASLGRLPDFVTGLAVVAEDQAIVAGRAGTLERLGPTGRLPLARDMGSLPFPVSAIGGRAGAPLLVGGTGGVARLSGNSFDLVSGTANLDVRALWERADGKLFTATMGVLKSCSQNSECEGSTRCVDGLCTGAAINPGQSNACVTAGCPTGTLCGKYPGQINSFCSQSVEIHETQSGADTLAFSGAPWGTPQRFFGDDVSGRMFVPLTKGLNIATVDLLAFRSAWQTSGFNCVNSSPVNVSFASPGVLITGCDGWRELDFTGPSVTTTYISGVLRAPQLSDPASFLVIDSTGGRQRTGAGYLPVAVPTDRYNIVGGKLGKLVAFYPQDSTSELRFYANDTWSTRSLPFHELDIKHLWTTDSWDTAYAVVRGGGLLRCQL